MINEGEKGIMSACITSTNWFHYNNKSRDVNKGRTGEMKWEKMCWVQWLGRRSLIFIGWVSIEVVSHKEDVRSRRDRGTARTHNLKAQETKRTHQLSYTEGKEKKESVLHFISVTKNIAHNHIHCIDQNQSHPRMVYPVPVSTPR